MKNSISESEDNLKNGNAKVTAQNKHTFSCKPNFSVIRSNDQFQHRAKCEINNNHNTKLNEFQSEKYQLGRKNLCNHYANKKRFQYTLPTIDPNTSNAVLPLGVSANLPYYSYNCQSIEDKWSESLSKATQHFNRAKEGLLDYIYPYDGNEINIFNDMPPCVPIDIICNCQKPSSIYRVPHQTCEYCGESMCYCGDCGKSLSRCIHCRNSLNFKCISTPNIICDITSKLCKSNPKPTPLPELIVTARGPFQKKREAYRSHKCSLCNNIGCSLCNSVSNCAYTIGSSIKCCQRDAPPAPVPGRVLHKLIPSFFQSDQILSKKFWNRWCNKDRNKISPSSGVLGFVEDLGLVLSKSVALSLESIGDMVSSNPEYPYSNEYKCDCSPPVKIYPKNGQYPDIVDPPTRFTGCRVIDALNNYIDSLLYDQINMEDIPSDSESIVETEKTGNFLVDSVNSLLDHVIQDTPEIIPTVKNNKPIKALAALLSEPQRDLPHLSGMFSSINPFSKNNFIHKLNLNKNFDIKKFINGSCLNRDYIDYVDFNILPNDLSIIQSERDTVRENNSNNTLTPIPVDRGLL